MPACCQEIVLKSKSKKSHAELADLLGVYKYMFDEKRIADIEKGLFVYKHSTNNRYIYRTSNAPWSVSRPMYYN